MDKLEKVYADFVIRTNYLAAQSSNTGNGHNYYDYGHRESIKLYQCPLKCEGDKRYSHVGNCPDCNMYLARIK
jgi:hypothetical protein